MQEKLLADRELQPQRAAAAEQDLISVFFCRGSDEGRLSAQSKSHARTPSRTGMRRSRPDREPPAAESSSVSSKGRTSRQGHMPRIHKNRLHFANRVS